MATWRVHDGGAETLVMALSTDNGNSWNEPFNFDGLTPNDSTHRVLTDGRGTWAIVWHGHGQDPNNRTDGDIYGIFSGDFGAN